MTEGEGWRRDAQDQAETVEPAEPPAFEPVARTVGVGGFLAILAVALIVCGGLTILLLWITGAL